MYNVERIQDKKKLLTLGEYCMAFEIKQDDKITAWRGRGRRKW